MSLFGRFLEISIPVPDIQESLAWYRLLGFTECTVGDVYEHHYAVVTDGRVYIGLHAAGLKELSLTFVRPGLTGHIPELQQLGLEVDDVYQGDERFHELLLHDPTGLPARLIEARTFSATTLESPCKAGQLRQIALSTRQPEATVAFWKQGGFDSYEDEEEDDFELLTPGMSLSVAAGKIAEPTLSFHCEDMQTLRSLLEKENLSYRKKGEQLHLFTPEDTLIVVSG